MSEYHEKKTEYRDAELLCEALKAQGYNPVVHASAVQLEDYHGHMRPDLAEIVIPRAQIDSAANDIGYKRQADGTYSAIISAYDLGKHGERWQKQVKISYADAGVMRKAARAGLRFIGRKKVGNKLELQFMAR